MNKPNKRDSLNLIFSALLILGYVVCSYFFLTFSEANADLAPYVKTLVFIVFGLIVFYATRVGEGKPIKRFSIWTLIVLDIPALYTILAQLIPGMPLHQQIAYLDGATALPYSPIFILACVALGYGIPYTFLSGFEAKSEDEKATDEDTEDCCGCCECCECDEKPEFVYTVCDAETEGALLVVDDLDTAFDKEKEIRLSDVTPCNEDITIGSFVVYTEATAAE